MDIIKSFVSENKTYEEALKNIISMIEKGTPIESRIRLISHSFTFVPDPLGYYYIVTALVVFD